MKSFIDHGHCFHLYSYESFELPQGVERREAREILPEARAFSQSGGMGSGGFGGFSDLFRYRLLLDRGGWWVDTDVVCLAREIAEPDIFFGWQDEQVINGAILRFPAGHPLVESLYREAEAKGETFEWGAIGPNLLTATIRGGTFASHATPAALAYPIRWQDALHPLLPPRAEEVRTRVGSAPFLHLWNEVFRQAGVLQWAGPPPESFLADLFLRHGIAVREPAYSGDEMTRMARNLSAAINAGKAEAEVRRLQAELAKIRAEYDRLSAAAPRPA